MIILPKPLEFEWNKGNTDKSFLKHNVTAKEAEQAFKNKPTFIIEDEKHSLTEPRYILWGTSNAKRKLAIIFTIREVKIRVISARDMNKKERRAYEERI